MRTDSHSQHAMMLFRAAVTIQRQFRQWRGVDVPSSSNMPPPPSPMTREASEVVMDNKPSESTGGHMGARAGRAGGSAPQSQAVEEIKLDYDTYLKNRRPGSTGYSEASASSRRSKLLVDHDLRMVTVLSDFLKYHVPHLDISLPKCLKCKQMQKKDEVTSPVGETSLLNRITSLAHFS